MTRPNDAGARSVNDGLALSAIQQAVVLLLAAGMLDGGALFQMVCYASLSYWGGFALMARRSQNLTRLDHWLIRWGFLILCIFSYFLSGLIWSIQGYGGDYALNLER